MGVKLLHIVSDNNLINVVQRFVLSPFERCGNESVAVFHSSFLTWKTVLLLTQLPEYDELSRPECFSK